MNCGQITCVVDNPGALFRKLTGVSNAKLLFKKEQIQNGVLFHISICTWKLKKAFLFGFSF
jgi:hypothetical protein